MKQKIKNWVLAKLSLSGRVHEREGGDRLKEIVRVVGEILRELTGKDAFEKEERELFKNQFYVSVDLKCQLLRTL